MLILFILFLIGAIALAVRLFEFRCLHRLEASLIPEVSRACAQEPFDLILTIANMKMMILPVIHLRIELPKDIEVLNEPYPSSSMLELSTSLFPYQRVRRRIALRSPQRGLITLKGHLEFTDFLGLTSQTLSFKPISLIVHPAFPAEPIQCKALSGLLGDQPIQRWIHPDPIFYTGSRSYTQQDTMKEIDWKASARLRELRVKQHDGTTDFHVYVALLVENNENLFAENPDYLEDAVTFCAGLIQLAQKNQTALGLISNAVKKADPGPVFRPASAPHHLLCCMDTLAVLSPFKQSSGLRILQQLYSFCQPNDECFLIAHQLTKEILDALSSLEARGILITLVLAVLPESIMLPPKTRLVHLPRRQLK